MDSFHIWYKWSLAWGVSHVMTFDLDLYLQGHSTLFWLGIQHDSIVWVIMRRRGVSSEHRRSSCSSLILMCYIWQSMVIVAEDYSILHQFPICVSLIYIFIMWYIENNVCTWVTNCFCTHKRIICVVISQVAKQWAMISNFTDFERT